MWAGLILMFAVVAVVSFTAGQFWYRWRLRRALSRATSVSESSPVPDPLSDAPLNHDAAFRILKEWGHR